MKRAVFIDRDGTINVERHYLHKPEEFELIPGVAKALRQLQDAGFLLVVVTNQAGIGRGYYTEDDMHRVHDRMHELLDPEGVRFTGIYFAPEAPHQPSERRKPAPGMLLDAQRHHGIHLGGSYMIGDKRIDLEAGWNAGCKASLLVRTGYGREVELNEADQLNGAPVVNDLVEAAAWILKNEGLA